MKNCYFRLLLSALFLLSFSALKAQTYTVGDISVTPIPTMVHDSSQCMSTCTLMYAVTINSSFLNDSLMVVDTNTASLIYAAGNTTGASPWTLMVPIPMYYGTTTDLGLTGGYTHFTGPTTKFVSGTDTIHGIPNDYSLAVTNPCIYSTISGQVYFDNNGDCAYNTGDVPLQYLYVYTTTRTTAPIWSGVYVYGTTNATGNYTTTIAQSWLDSAHTFLPPYYSFIFPSVPCAPSAYDYTTLPQTNLNFPLQCSSNVDLEVWSCAPVDVRPLRTFYMQPRVHNTGCDTTSGTLTFIKDSRVTYNPALSYWAPDYVNGDTLSWNYYDLTNLTSGAYWNSFAAGVSLTPNSTVSIGDTLTFKIYTGTPAVDVNPANNLNIMRIPVVASYDPNIKEVSPKGTGATGDIPATTPLLTYTIHFQNTGTAAAYNVSVVDTLDGDVDAASLQILAASHQMQPQWLAPNVVKFNFNNINLPDSFHNEAMSHGSVHFSVKMHSGLAAGTQIKNKGYIYFDTNPAVITNQALNTIVHTAGVNNVAVSEIKVYPNPATDEIFVENLQDGNISILNISGSVVLNQNITNNKTTVNISHLPAGMYLLKTVSKDGVSTRKFVKE